MHADLKQRFVVGPVKRSSRSPAGWIEARLIADGLMRGNGWDRADCTDTLNVVKRPASPSFSFCYKYSSNHIETLTAIERIFHERRNDWQEIGWTEFQHALGGVYRSTWEEGRYLVVVIGGYNHLEDYTNVVLGIGRES